ncbi:MAG: hypothetical protein CXZ00_08555 [Acidobacteria bacterium]|nr:MAG: hypothetical protein CXZ00_08555 [Acidobacteriota bacterium]
MKRILCTLIALFGLSLTAYSSDIPTPNPEVGFGYTYISGNQGLNGFNVSAAALFSRRIAVAFDYDTAWDTSSLGAFTGTPIGQVVSKAHLQNVLIGPRVYFPGLIKTSNQKVKRLHPFAELEFGGSDLGSSLDVRNLDTHIHSSETVFAWMLGGGADYRLGDHWAARGRMDLLRTHFVNEGQSRFRLVLGIAYTFKAREY